MEYQEYITVSQCSPMTSHLLKLVLYNVNLIIARLTNIYLL